MKTSTMVLRATGLTVTYGGAAPAVDGVDLAIAPGEVVALLGVNGAGKTTTLMALAGELRPVSGEVQIDGRVVTSAMHQRARQGIGVLTEERCIFPSLSVRDNLRVGRGGVEGALAFFPELTEHLGRRAGLLSGGQQQMLALARILAARPRVILADELSLGLAPIVVTRLLEAVRAAADQGVGVLLVEQHVRLALGVSDRFYVMRRGRVVHEGTPEDLGDDPDRLASLYLEGQHD